MKKLFFVLALMIGLSVGGFAAEYYVNYSDGTGAMGTSPEAAASSIAVLQYWLQPGDIINVTGDGGEVLRNLNGTADAPITIRPYKTTSGSSHNGWLSVGASGSAALYMIKCSYIIVDGARKDDGERDHIELRQAVKGGVVLNNSHHCVFKNINLHDFNDGDTYDCAAFREENGSHHNTFVRNRISGVGGTSHSSVAFDSDGNTEAGSSVFAYNTVVGVGNVTRTSGGSSVIACNNVCYNIRGNASSGGSTAVFTGSTATNNNISYNYVSKYTSGVTGRIDLWTDPKLTGLDYRLAENSPARNVGNSVEILTDNGLTYIGTAPDLGCYESEYENICTISGTVTDVDGNPIDGVQVYGSGANSVCYTDSAGHYSLNINRIDRPTVEVVAWHSEYESQRVSVNTAPRTISHDFVLNFNQYSVSGRVTYFDKASNSNKGISGAVITLNGNTTVADANGDFYIRTRRVGVYDLAITAEGYEGYYRHLEASTSTGFYMTVLLTPICVMTGTVMSTFTGSPVAGAAVTIGDITVTTDSDGKYDIIVKQAYSYSVKVTVGGYTYYETLIVNTAAYATEDITLQDACKVYGNVVSDEDEAPVAGAVVAVDEFETTTDDDGYYEVTVRSPGTRNVTVDVEGYMTYRDTVSANQSAVFKKITLVSACIVTGTVTSPEGEPVVGAAVSVGETESVTDEFGGFEAKVPKSDSVAVTVTAEGYFPYSGAVDASGSSAQTDINLSYTCVISGTVRDSFSGDPCEARVTVGDITVITGPGGEYSVTVPRAPSYDVGAAGIVSFQSFHYGYSGTVAADRDAVTMDIFLNRNGMDYCVIEGRVVSAQGKSLEGVKVSVGDRYCYTDLNGRYGVTVEQRTSVTITVTPGTGYFGTTRNILARGR
ncbi:MAG: carboxypeptidase regulatory-like domain-containing protein, partial [Abditibacteriota bacterium]|nr:carboxypeptidase regulatory-like domain-containing protein [Abditibacteriota bacterium]